MQPFSNFPLPGPLRPRPRKSFHWAWLGVVLTSMLGACGGSPTSAVEGECTSAGHEGLSASHQLTVDVPVTDSSGVVSYETGPAFSGSRAVWDRKPDGWIALGPEATGEPVGQIAMTTTRPDGECRASVVTATMSTSDVRVGTAEEINGKLYELVDAGQTVQVIHVNEDEFVGHLLRLVELIILPTEAPRLGETIRVTGTFIARKPGR